MVEGESAKADRNKLQDHLRVTGEDISRDLPAGSEVEVTLHYDEDRIIWAKAYIPILDAEFEAIIDQSKHQADPVELKKEFHEEKKRLDQLRVTAGDSEEMDSLEDEMEELEDIVRSAEDDGDASNKAESRILEMRIALDKREDDGLMPAIERECIEALDELDGLIDAHGDDEQREQARTLREEVEELVEQNNADRLRKKIEQIADLHREILFAQPWFWSMLFEETIKRKNEMTDQPLADRFIGQGRQCVDHGNVQGLRNAVAQLMDLLPHEIADEIKRGYGSGIIIG